MNFTYMKIHNFMEIYIHNVYTIAKFHLAPQTK